MKYRVPGKSSASLSGVNSSYTDEWHGTCSAPLGMACCGRGALASWQLVSLLSRWSPLDAHHLYFSLVLWSQSGLVQRNQTHYKIKRILSRSPKERCRLFEYIPYILDSLRTTIQDEGFAKRHLPVSRLPRYAAVKLSFCCHRNSPYPDTGIHPELSMSWRAFHNRKALCDAVKTVVQPSIEYSVYEGSSVLRYMCRQYSIHTLCSVVG